MSRPAAANADLPPETDVTGDGGLRERMAAMVLALVWLHVAASVALAYGSTGAIWPLGAAALSCAVLGTVAWRALSHRGAARAALAVSLTVAAGMLPMAAGDAAWARQLATAYPLVVVAVLGLLLDWVAIVVAAATAIAMQAGVQAMSSQAGVDPVPILVGAALLCAEAGALGYLAARAAALVERSQAMRRAAIKGIEAAKAAREISKAALEGKARSLDERKDFERHAADDRDLALGTLASALDRLAAGDFDVRLTSPMPTQYDLLRERFDKTVEALAAFFESFARSAADLGSSAGATLEQASGLARQAEQRADTLRDAAEQLKAATRAAAESIEKATGASEVVVTARRRAERGEAAVRNAIDAMGGINASADRIAKIIGVIDGIAFQTNLLALNAGVEAARAGDHGRGFAVVASEVRALSQRTAESAKEVKALIARSSQQVGEGSRLVEEVGGEVRGLLAGMAEIGTAMAASVESGSDVARRLQQVDGAMRIAGQSARETATLADGTRAAVAALSDAAAALSRAADRLPGTDAAASPTVAAVVRQPVSRPVAIDRVSRHGPEEIKRMRRSIPVVDGAAARSLVDYPEGGEGQP